MRVAEEGTLNPGSWSKLVLCARIHACAGLLPSCWGWRLCWEGQQRSGSAGKAEHRALSCWSSGAEAHLSVIPVLAFDIALRQGEVMWLL